VVDIDSDNPSNEEKTLYTFPMFSISQILNGFEQSTKELQGYIQLQIENQWSLNGDYSIHAYAPMKCSELFKKVMKESNHGDSKFIIDNSNFDESSDEGKSPRYKFGESDYEFLVNKVLPFTSINQQPAYFFVNEKNKVFLKTFKSLYDKEPKTLIVTDSSTPQEYSEELQKILDNKGLNSVLAIIKANCMIGSDEKGSFTIEQLKQKIFYTDPISNKTIGGKQLPSVKLASSAGEMAGDLLPISEALMTAIESTSSKILHFRTLDDQIGLSTIENRKLDGLFTFNCTVNLFTGNTISLGDTVFFFQPTASMKSASGDKEYSSHWLNDKWVVAKITYSNSPGDPKVLQTSLTLIRPTFMLNKKNTSLDVPQLFYQI
jgi:hypothetical protein